MAKVERSLSIEKRLGTEEAKKDIEILGKVADTLPSASKIKIYKKNEENRDYIASVSAEDFANTDPHEYVKNKFAKKHGGGDYLIELLSSDGEPVQRRVISIIDETEKKPEDTKQARIVEEALQMREDAFDKVKEAEKEKREAEKMKYDTAIEGMSRQWDTIQKMYDSQIAVLREQLEGTKDRDVQSTIERQIDRIQREFDSSKNKFEIDMKSREEGKVATEKMFDLVNTLIPMILQRSTKEDKDPVEELSKTITLVNSLTGGKKDIIESFIENPERMQLFQKLLGINAESKKGTFDDVLENPMKMEMFRKMLGIEEKRDFLVDMIDNPQRFDIFRKLTGIDKQEDLIKEVKRLGDNIIEKSAVPIEEPKGFIDEILEAKNKFEALKNLFQPSQPAKTFVELVSTLVSGAGPYVAQAVNSYMNGMITLEMLRKGMINKSNLPPQLLSGQGFQGIANIPDNAPQVKKTKPETKEQENKEVKLEDAFRSITINILQQYQGALDGEIFVDKVVDAVILNVKRNPSLIFQIMKYEHDGIVEEMSTIFMELLRVEKPISDGLAKQIANKVVEGMKK